MMRARLNLKAPILCRSVPTGVWSVAATRDRFVVRTAMRWEPFTRLERDGGNDLFVSFLRRSLIAAETADAGAGWDLGGTDE